MLKHFNCITCKTSCQIMLPTFWVQNPQTIDKTLTPNSQNGIYNVPLNKIE